jgi:uncharacterized protein (UPF0254 family)
MAAYIYDSTDNYLFSSADYGFTYEVKDSAEDFGLITAVKDTTEDYQFVTVTSNNSTPFGFSTVSGSATTWKPKRYLYSSSSDNLYTLEDYGDIVLVEIYGQIDESPASTLDWGSLDTVTSSEDFGVVTTFTATTPDSTEDYGTIIVVDNVITREDRYLIITNQSILAMETGYTSSSSGASYTFTANTPDNTQLFSISGALISKVVFTWVGSGNPFEIGGSADEIILAFSTVGTSGPLRLDGTSTEVFTKSYSLDAVVPFNILDYGSVPTSPTLDVDFGLVSQASFGGEKDYGLITDTQEVSPYGLYQSDGLLTESFTKGLYTGQGTISISGEVLLPLAVTIIGVGSILSTGFSTEKNTESYVGTGSLFSTSGAAEKVRFNPPEDETGAFDILGTATEKNTERYVGIALDIFLSGGYTGKFTSGAGETTQLFSLSGAATEKNRESYVGAGTFSSLSGAAEKVCFNPPEDETGLFNIIGTSTEKNTERYVGIALDIFLFGGYTGKFTSEGGESTQLFALSGSGVEKNTEDYVGTGESFIDVTSVEKNTEAYVSEPADVTDLFVDYGDFSAATESEDYGLITSAATNVDYRYLTSDFYQITGAAVEKFIAQTPENTQLFTLSGAAVEKFTSEGGESIQVFTFTGNGVEKNTEVYIGEGTFSSFSGAAESVTYRYSFDSFVPFFEFDYGSVAQVPSNEINLGNITSEITGGEQDYGIITYNDSVFPYGLWQTSGAALDAFSKKIVDNGGSIIISGAVVLPLAVTIIGQGSFALDITSIEKNTEDYVASGSLFSTSGAAEVFGANPLESTQAFITSGTAVEKFRANPPEDFALYTFSGVAIEKFATQGAETTQLFTLSGSAIEKNRESYVGTGSTSIDVTKVEKNTESYFAPLPAFIFANVNNGQIDDPAVNEDYGLITQAANEFDNLQGLVLDYIKVSGFADESFVAPSPENTQLFIYAGAGVEKNTESYVGDKPTYTLSGNRVEKNTESYVGTGTATIDISSEVRKTLPSYVGFGFAFTANGSAEAFGANPLENTQLFQISGAAVVKVNPKWIGSGTILVDITSVEKNTESYVGTGSLFSIVDGSEARTYVYDETTSVLFLELDYGSLTQPVDTINDFGQITNFFNEVDYGTVVYTESVFPFGSAFFGGSAVEAFSPNTPENTQIFVFAGSAVEKFTSGAGESTQLFSLSGAAVEKNTEDYVGTGVTAFTGTAVEKFRANPPEDFVLYTFNGTAIEKFRANPPEDFALYTFSGTAVEKFTSGAGESTQLFNLSGVVVEKNTESYVGTGNAFTFIDSEEARTYDYTSEIGVYTTEISGDISSAVDTTEDYGLIISGVTTTENWGSCLPDVIKLKGGLVESFTEGVYDASGSITISGEGKVREIPRWIGGGTITISGNGTVPLTLIVVGSGSLFSTSGATESVGANPPEDFALFNVTGAAVVRSTPRWIGSGAANIDVTHVMRFVPNWNGSGTISIDTTSVEKNTESYVGTGSAFTFIDSGESVTFDYAAEIPEILHEYRNLINQTTVSTEDYGLISVAADEFDIWGNTERSYIQIIPTSIVKATPRQTGSGTISIDVTHTMRFVPNWNGFGTISIDATSIERNTESYVGLGGVNLTGDADEDLVKVFVGDDGQSRPIFLEGSAQRINIKKYEDTVNYVLSGGSVEKFTSGAGESTQLFSLSGNAVQKNTEPYVGIGTLFGIGGGAEARVYVYGENVIIGFNEVDYGFITETPTIDIDYSTITIGEIGGIIDYGQIRFEETIISATGLVNITGAVYVTTSPAYYGAGTLALSDTALESNTEVYTGTGFISTFSGAAEVFGVNPPENTQLFALSGAGNTREIVVYTASASGTTTLNGASVEKNTEDYVGVGTTTLSGTKVEKNTEVFIGFVTETLSGVGLCVNTKVYTGNGIISSPSGAAEAFGANPPENTQLFVYAGAATEKNTEDYVGLGTTTLSGTKVEKNTEVFIGAGTSTLSGSGVEKNTEVYIGTGSTSLSGVAETRLLYLYRFETDGFGTFVFLSQDATKVSVRNYKVIPGSIDISITSVEKNTEAFSGLGELFGFNGAAESRTINPEEDTVLYTFVGAAVAKNTEKWVGTGATTLSGTKVEKNTESYVGTGLSALTGAGVEKNTEVFIGTGNLFTASGAAESVGVNPPENTHLFVYSGAAVERNTESYVGTGTETITGTAVESNTESYVGTGVLNALSGAAEAYSAQTPENTVLFIFTGAGTERFIAQTPENTQLFKFTGTKVEKNTEVHFGTGTATLVGTAVERNTEAYNGTGTLTASGVGLEVFSPVYVGSGGFINYSGSAESFGANPPEDISLFTVLGSATERNTEAHFATGEATVTGVAVEKNTESYVGVGQLFSYTGAAESITVNPEEDTVLFTFVGFAAESFSAQTPENTQLFEITGFSVERNTEVYDGSGTLTASGDAYSPIFKAYFGSGSIFAINGAAESFGANPPEDTVLYNFVGAATERNTEVYYGEEVIFIDVDSTESASRFYDGFGSFATLSGGAESFGANPPENTQLFTYTGSASEKNTESYTGLGNIDIDIFAAENVTESYIGSGTSTISGFADISETNIVIASGSLFTFYGASESTGVNPPENIALFTYNGAAVERNTESYQGLTDISVSGSAIETNTEYYEGTVEETLSGVGDISSTSSYFGETNIHLSGAGTEEYDPGGYRGKGTATISGTSTECITEVFVASGSLFGFGGSAEATTNVADSNIFATISGSAVITKTNIVLGNGTLFTFNGSAESISRNPDTETTAFIISGSSTTVNNPYRPPRTYVSII